MKAQQTSQSQGPAYSAESSVKTPLTACRYREQAAYEVVLKVNSNDLITPDLFLTQKIEVGVTAGPCIDNGGKVP